MLDPEDRDAVLLHVAIKKGGVPDYRVIIEQSCIYCPEEFLGVRRAYQARYKRSFEEDLAQNSTADFRRACSYIHLIFTLMFLYIQRP